jgi:hypothetical protein
MYQADVQMNTAKHAIENAPVRVLFFQIHELLFFQK